MNQNSKNSSIVSNHYFKQQLNDCKFTDLLCLTIKKKINILTIFPHLKNLALSAVLFIFYFLLLGFWLTRIKIVKETEIGTPVLLILFTIKIMAGIAVGLASYYIFKYQTDYFQTNLYGIQEYHSLFESPKVFFTDLFKSNYTETGEFFGSRGSYWNDLRLNIIYKALAFTNIFSRGNYYINSLFFNFVSFIGSILLYKVFINVYPSKKWQIAIGCFLLPSTLYFGSGIFKDLIVLTALSAFCYSLYFGLMKGFNGKKMIYLLLSFVTILFIRNFIAVILLPCAFTWIITYKYKLPAIKSFVTLFVAGIVVTTILQQFSQKVNPLLIVVKKQQAFFALGKANTDYKMDSLQPTIKSFAEQAPSALRHSFLSPYPMEFQNLYMNLFSLEIISYWILFVLMLLFPAKIKHNSQGFIVFSVAFTFLIFLFSGYITPAAGALIRYRSIYFPFIIIPILCNINWEDLFYKAKFLRGKQIL